MWVSELFDAAEQDFLEATAKGERPEGSVPGYRLDRVEWGGGRDGVIDARFAYKSVGGKKVPLEVAFADASPVSAAFTRERSVDLEYMGDSFRHPYRAEVELTSDGFYGVVVDAETGEEHPVSDDDAHNDEVARGVTEDLRGAFNSARKHLGSNGDRPAHVSFRTRHPRLDVASVCPVSGDDEIRVGTVFRYLHELDGHVEKGVEKLRSV